MSKRKCDGLAQLVSSYFDEEDSDQNTSSNEDEDLEEQIAKEGDYKKENGIERTKKIKLSPDQAAAKKEEASLPLPTGILDMFKDNDAADDTASHGGRVRSFDHFPGNWALHVYAPFPAHESLSSVIQCLVDCLPKAIGATMHLFPLPDLHLSLSRTVPVRHYWIEPIVQQLRDSLSTQKRFNCIIERPHFYVNDEKTRSFLGLKISTGEQLLRNLISLVDDVLAGFALPKFYENPSFHISVAWCLGDVYTQITQDDEDRLQTVFDSMMTEKLSSSLMFGVSEVRCKIGNKLFNFSLAE